MPVLRVEQIPLHGKEKGKKESRMKSRLQKIVCFLNVCFLHVALNGMHLPVEMQGKFVNGDGFSTHKRGEFLINVNSQGVVTMNKYGYEDTLHLCEETVNGEKFFVAESNSSSKEAGKIFFRFDPSSRTYLRIGYCKAGEEPHFNNYLMDGDYWKGLGSGSSYRGNVFYSESRNCSSQDELTKWLPGCYCNFMGEFKTATAFFSTNGYVTVGFGVGAGSGRWKVREIRGKPYVHVVLKTFEPRLKVSHFFFEICYRYESLKMSFAETENDLSEVAALEKMKMVMLSEKTEHSNVLMKVPTKTVLMPMKILDYAGKLIDMQEKKVRVEEMYKKDSKTFNAKYLNDIPAFIRDFGYDPKEYRELQMKIRELRKSGCK